VDLLQLKYGHTIFLIVKYNAQNKEVLLDKVLQKYHLVFLKMRKKLEKRAKHGLISFLEVCETFTGLKTMF